MDLATARITLYRTKSGKPRGIPINTAVYDALIALEPDPRQRLGRLFKKANGAGWDRIRTAFELALRRAKIQDFRFHDLRHTFASHAVMWEVSLAELKELLGHSTLTMTLRYAHPSPTHLRGAVARLDGLTSAPTVAPRAHERAHDAILEARPQGSTRNPDTGGVAERLKAPVLKTGIPQGIGGSNPSPSATHGPRPDHGQSGRRGPNPLYSVGLTVRRGGRVGRRQPPAKRLQGQNLCPGFESRPLRQERP